MIDKGSQRVSNLAEPKSAFPEELWPIIAFCLIGLLATIDTVLYFPDWGYIIERFNTF